MAPRPWSIAERRAAALLADDWLSSTEDGAAPPGAVLEALQRAEAVATPHQLPCALLGAGANGAVVCLRLADFAAWFAPDGRSVACLRPGTMATRG